LALWQVDEVGEPGLIGNEKDRAGAVVVRCHGPASRRLGLQFGPDLLEAMFGVRQEDEPERRTSKLNWRQLRVRSDLIRR
jgi:hypothetical protein